MSISELWIAPFRSELLLVIGRPDTYGGAGIRPHSK